MMMIPPGRRVAVRNVSLSEIQVGAPRGFSILHVMLEA